MSPLKDLIRPWFVYEEVNTSSEEVVFRSPSHKSALRGLVTGAFFGMIGGFVVLIMGAHVASYLFASVIWLAGLLALVKGAVALFSQGALLVLPAAREVRHMKRTPLGTRVRSFGFDDLDCVHREERVISRRSGSKYGSTSYPRYVGRVTIRTRAGEMLRLGEGDTGNAAALAKRLSQLLDVEEQFRRAGDSVRVRRTAGPCPNCGFAYAYDGNRCGHCGS